ncbi:MAG: V-type ATP synthase subunit D [Thermoplasmata archaeon]|jgi:V/A-type H+-transporting ATPase subunit D|nr:MAG: V-type ATP synthase subunit D [Thermoplasmata archaeon]
MAKEIMEGVKPTRMQLLEIRKRKLLAVKGHELLSQKRDALISNFFEIIKNRKEKRKEMEEKIREAFESLIEAEMLMGEEQVRTLSEKVEEKREVSAERKNVMGVPIINFNIEEGEKANYGVLDTTSELYEAAAKGREALDAIVEVAGIEGSIQKLGKEIEKTKRRVNALEHIFIPKLEGTITYIERQLEEREREDFFRRKRMKAFMEQHD